MNQTIINQLTWKDIHEIVTEADLMLSTTHDAKEYPTPESYYGEVLNRLRAKAKKESIMRKYAFLERHGIELCWRHAFSCISEEGKATENDIYYVTEDNRFLIKIPKGETRAMCLDIKELDLLPNEYDIPPIPDTVPEYGIKITPEELK